MVLWIELAIYTYKIMGMLLWKNSGDMREKYGKIFEFVDFLGLCMSLERYYCVDYEYVICFKID